jgi:hypothetical protein
MVNFLSIRLRSVGLAMLHPVVCSRYWGKIAEEVGFLPTLMRRALSATQRVKLILEPPFLSRAREHIHENTHTHTRTRTRTRARARTHTHTHTQVLEAEGLPYDKWNLDLMNEVTAGTLSIAKS